MKVIDFLWKTFLAGLIVLAPIFLTGLLDAKGFQTIAATIRPVKHLLPHWLPNEEALAILLLLAICFVLGLALRTGIGRWMQQWIERTLLTRIPGYTQLRDLALQVAGDPIGPDRRCLYHGSQTCSPLGHSICNRIEIDFALGSRFQGMGRGLRPYFAPPNVNGS